MMRTSRYAWRRYFKSRLLFDCRTAGPRRRHRNASGGEKHVQEADPEVVEEWKWRAVKYSALPAHHKVDPDRGER